MFQNSDLQCANVVLQDRNCAPQQQMNSTFTSSVTPHTNRRHTIAQTSVLTMAHSNNRDVSTMDQRALVENHETHVADLTQQASL